MGQLRDTIESKLKDALSPTLLEIEDFSARHAGHFYAGKAEESHFHVTIESEKFRGLSRLDQQRLVHTALALELSNKIHALTLDLRIPDKK